MYIQAQKKITMNHRAPKYKSVIVVVIF